MSTAGGAPAGVAHDSGGSPMPPRAQPPSSDEAALMTRLRAATDPALALDLAREGNRRFPDSADAPERASIEIHALAAQGRASEARETAEEMVNRYPDSPWVREVERLTGAHRHRNLRLNAQGQVESY
ncbi:MAG TPA: hypothetical protein VEK07_19915 [Polyangiaceae bacterium]|nr:hypothetical protein [Polyangiaceae bacterium]